MSELKQLTATVIMLKYNHYCISSRTIIYRSKWRNDSTALSVDILSAASPANPLRGSSLKPAVDSVNVHRCCAYPTIHMLQEGWPSRMSPQVLQSLRQELITSSCHLATAAPPGAEGNFLRISTTFLERRLMRSLTDVQGQMFILLKYLIKKIISARVGGLKSYHAKTLLFYMLEELPSEEWQPSNLVALIRRALQMLLRHLQERGTANNECMKHFFMRDAIVYLKKGGCEKAETAQVVTETIKKLDQLLLQFLGTLEPLQTSDFYFHPFLVIPGLSFEIVSVKPAASGGDQLEYHEIYTMVISLLHLLAQESNAAPAFSMTADIDRIPDCAFSAREGLRVMAYLRQGRSSEACQLLENSREHMAVSRGMPFEASDSTAEGVSSQMVDQVWRHLRGTDSAWKFFFRSKKRPELDFLPVVMRPIFPLQMRNYRTYFYLNFDALIRCLRHHLLVDGEQSQETSRWIEELLQSSSMDPQELLVGLQCCSKIVNVDLVARLIQAHADTIDEYPELRLTTDMLMQQLTGLKEAATVKTLTNMKEELQRLLKSNTKFADPSG